MNYVTNSMANSDALKYGAGISKCVLARIQRYGLDGDYTKKQKGVLNEMTKSTLIL